MTNMLLAAATIRPDAIIYLLDMIGVIACATAGTILAQRKGLDLFGCILIAMVGAIGGGTIRDLMLARHPLFWMMDLSYLVVITMTSILVQWAMPWQHKLDGAIKLFDAIGLATFSIIGFSVAQTLGAHPAICVMMGILTSIAGGIMRDMICNEIPLVLRKEIYITASLIGLLAHLVMQRFGIALAVINFIVLILIFGIRMLAIRYDWSLPVIGRRA